MSSENLEALRATEEVLRRALALAQSAVYAAEGDQDAAEWKAAEAERRTEDSKRAWVRMMARMHINSGDGPEMGSHLWNEIMLEMAAMRKAAEPEIKP